MNENVDSIDLDSMCDVALQAGTLEDLTGLTTPEEITRAWTLAMILAQLHNLQLVRKS